MKAMTSSYMEKYIQIGDKIRILSFDELEEMNQKDICGYFIGKKWFLGKTLTVSQKHYHEGTNQWYCAALEDHGQYCWWPSFVAKEANVVPAMKVKGLPCL